MSKGNVLYDDGNFIPRSVTAGITASTSQSQGNGALTSEFNEVSTCANPNDTVTLPTAVAGRRVFIINNGANDLQVFPASGDDLGAGTNNSVTIGTAQWAEYSAYDGTNWQEVNEVDTSNFIEAGTTDTLTNKTIDGDNNTITNIGHSELETSQLRTTKVSMSSAQIKLLGTNGFTLLAAPGANKTIELHKIVCFNNFGTAAYVYGSGENIEVYYDTGTAGGGIGGINGDGGWGEATADDFYTFTAGDQLNGATTDYINKKIFMRTGTGPNTDPTTGDGTYDFFVSYWIHTTT